MKTQYDVAIVGGGLNGPALALALAGAGVTSILIDKQPDAIQADPNFDGRGYAISASSAKMLNALGVWPRVTKFSQEISEIKITDGRAGEGPAPWVLHFSGSELDDGAMGFIIEDRYLRQALKSSMDETCHISRKSGVTATGQNIEPGGVTLDLDDGSVISARLLVGCDGRASQVAARAGINRSVFDYNQVSLVCAVEHQKPHNGTAHQFFMPSGPLAILPLPGNRSSIVWTESTSRAGEIAAYDDEAYMETLRPRFGDFLGEISLAGRRFSYPLGLSVADSFVSERVALAGDAAHGIHPLAGQGLNLGLRDVAALAEVLVLARRRGLDIGSASVLSDYQRWRRFDTALLAAATDGVNRLFSNDNPLLRLGRDLGLGIVNGIPGLRRGLIREAAGLSGDLPQLLKGRAF